jgi:hypothetical protein
VISVSKRVPLNVRVDEEVRDAFRKFVKEKKGRIRNEMGRQTEKALKEYMDQDRLSRVETRLRDIEDGQQKIVDILEGNSGSSSQTGHSHAHKDDHLTCLNDLEPQTRKGIEETIDNLPDKVNKDDLERAVHLAGRTDDRTVEKYRKVLESHGFLLPPPDNPTAEGRWIHSLTKFALICEQNDAITVDDLERLVDELEQTTRFSKKAYRDALPDDYPEYNELKIDQIGSAIDIHP